MLYSELHCSKSPNCLLPLYNIFSLNFIKHRRFTLADQQRCIIDQRSSSTLPRHITEKGSYIHHGNVNSFLIILINNFFINVEKEFLIILFQPLKDIAVVSGQLARFECIVQAEPQPNILWSKDRRIVENSASHDIQYRNGVCRLTVMKASPGTI